MTCSWETIILSGGTYTPGQSWSAQFDDASLLRTWTHSSYGSLKEPEFGKGRRYRRAFMVDNPMPIRLWIENPSGTVGVQLQLDKVIIGEYLAATEISVDVAGGPHLLEVIAPDGAVVIFGAFLDGVRAIDISLYPQSSRTSSAGSTAGGATPDTGLGGLLP